MKTEHIEVVDYDSKWVNDFNQIKGEIEEALKDLVLVVEHVGSTSVPLLAAKPIIDLDVVIDQNDLKEVIYLLENHYFYTHQKTSKSETPLLLFLLCLG